MKPTYLRSLVIFFMAASALSACRPASLYWVEPEGPAEYQLGWQDGCDTGYSANSSLWFKALYGYKKRPELGANDLYKQGWNEGFTYCRFAHEADQKNDGFWGPFDGGGITP